MLTVTSLIVAAIIAVCLHASHNEKQLCSSAPVYIKIVNAIPTVAIASLLVGVFSCGIAYYLTYEARNEVGAPRSLFDIWCRRVCIIIFTAVVGVPLTVWLVQSHISVVDCSSI